MRNESIELLKKLCTAHGAPSGEEAVAQIFQDELQSVSEFQRDKMGGIYCETIKENTPKLLITGHMDEVGFAVQSIQKNGFLEFVPLGGWWTHTLLAQRVRVLTQTGEEIIGVICSKPPHFLDPAEATKVQPIEKLFIDIGADNQKHVEEMGVSIGDGIVPESPFTPMKNPDLFMCKAFDNRVGMGASIQAYKSLAKKDLPYTLVCGGTVQEELGVRGATVMANALKPDAALVLEGPPADDTPGFNRSQSQGALGKGVQIRLMDPTAIMNKKLARAVESCAKENDIPYQLTVRRSGGTDARAFQLSNQGIPVVVLGVPARYIHTHNSIININDYLALVELCQKFCEKLSAEELASY